MSNENPQTRTMPIAERRTALEAIGAAFEGFPLEEIETQLARIAAEGPRVADEEPTRTLNQERAERQQFLEVMREPFHGVSSEEIEREAAKAIAEVRGERRDKRNAAKRNQYGLFAIIEEMREAFIASRPRRSNGTSSRS